jgi:hypothetical protein
MDVDELLRSTALPAVSVATDDALASTVRRGRSRRHHRTAVLGTCAVLVAGGLVTGAVVLARDGPPEVATGSTASTAPSTDPAGPGAGPAAEPHECTASEGEVTDVATEPPEWRDDDSIAHPWTDREGCIIRIDVLTQQVGPDHCGWEKATVLTTGRPLGARYTTPSTDQQYIRDPEGVFGDPALAAAFDPDATLPATAVDSGFRRDGVQLWYDPADPSAVWMVGPDRTELWPAGGPLLCM